jgi:AcrR family transcriptional regulator
MRIVAEKGFAATTVADLTGAAGISRTTFYELFKDKDDCFLASYASALDGLVRRVSLAYETEERWPDRTRAGLAVLLEELAANPDQARLALVGIAAAGPVAQRRYRAAVQRLTPFLDDGRDFAPAGRHLPANTSRMAAGAVAGLISEELAASRSEHLPGLLPDVLFASLVPYLGPREAMVEIGAKLG